MVIGDSNGTISFFKEGTTKVSKAQVEVHKVTEIVFIGWLKRLVPAVGSHFV